MSKVDYRLSKTAAVVAKIEAAVAADTARLVELAREDAVYYAACLGCLTGEDCDMSCAVRGMATPDLISGLAKGDILPCSGSLEYTRKNWGFSGD